MDAFNDATHYTTRDEALRELHSFIDIDGMQKTEFVFLDPGYNESRILIATELIDVAVIFTRDEYWRIVNGD